MRCHGATQRETEGSSDGERDERFQEMLQLIIPEVRRRHSTYSEERLFETAIHIAAYRLRKEREQ